MMIGKRTITLLLILMLVACAEQRVQAPVVFQQPTYPEKHTVIEPGDLLTFQFYYTPELNSTQMVRPDGKVSLTLFQGIDVVGMTPEALQQRLVELYSREFQNPVITVLLEKRSGQTVFVTGEVLTGGSKPLTVNMTVGQMLAQSSVNIRNARMGSVVLVRRHAPQEYKVYLLDADFTTGIDRDVYLQPGDILYVPRNTITVMGDFVQKYIRDLLPTTTSVNLGLNYDLYRMSGLP